MKAPLEAGRISVAVFLLRCALTYGLLIFPWPGWNGTYGRYFRMLGELVFGQNGAGWIVVFTSASPVVRPPLDTQITLANRRQVDAHGNIPAKILALDSRAVGWVPTAFLAALIVATPVSWRRRGEALLWGLLWIHAFILFAIGVSVLNQAASEIGLLSLTRVVKQLVEGAEETLVDQMGASFVVPAIIWISVFSSTMFGQKAAPRNAPSAAVFEFR